MVALFQFTVTLTNLKNLNTVLCRWCIFSLFLSPLPDTRIAKREYNGSG